MKIVSACLAGINCRYDGKSGGNKNIIEMVKKGEAIPVCPEQLGGLSTPKEKHEIKQGRVISETGVDRTEEFSRGAQEALKIAKSTGCKKAILKAMSPSCGCGRIYDGNFSGNLVEGDGFFARLLKQNKISVKTEEEL
ncbi:hypothetical protein A3K73_06725 [Candidatus Pacearchaeota archaeon RBG_13_36_9]|nr:MAG: hypothetical protein A3K73_06725 [Candidatus Pacearchaeota archaeon RBG_13_36_9]